MNRTFFISCISVIIVCFGFGLFYFFKIVPVQQSIDASKQNIRIYQETVAINKKKLEQKNKALAERKQEIARQEALGQNVSPSILPNSPDIEQFFSNAHEKAESLGVTFASLSENQTNASAQAASNKQSNTNSTSSNQKNSKNTKPPVSLLESDTYSLNLTATNELSLLNFIDYLESQKRLLVINQMTFQMNNAAPVPPSSGSGPAASLSASSTVSVSLATPNTASSQTSQTTSSQSSGSTTSVQPQQPQYTATITLTLYSEKH